MGEAESVTNSMTSELSINELLEEARVSLICIHRAKIGRCPWHKLRG